jgi:hemoglobin/transferrin/lactoferrin receptor protein
MAMPRLTGARTALLLLPLSAPLAAQPDPAPQPDPSAATSADARALERITVTATAAPVAVGDAVATVSVIDADEIERQGARDIKDLVRYEPGVSVRNQPGRFGLSGFNIRGLDGNRVLVRIDGVRIADGFAIGSFANAGRDTVDIDTLKQAEILRGPASSLYGSSALAGVVSFVTKDPRDYLAGDDTAALRGKAGHASVDDGKHGGFTGAWHSGDFSALMHWTHRQGTEPDNQGALASRDGTRTVNNPQDYEDDALLLKGVLDLGGGDVLRGTLEGTRGRTDTEVLSALGTSRLGPSTIVVESLAGIDRAQRHRASLEWALGARSWFERARINAYVQQTGNTQDTREDRTTIAASGARAPVTRERRFEFDQDLAGLEAAFRHDFSTGPLSHRLTWGSERLRTDTAQRRDGLQRNRVTGATTNVVVPDVFPVRDFPLSETTETGLFVEDEITLLDGRLSLVPGLRWDRFELQPQPDPVFAADNPGIVPVAIDESNLTPRLGAAWKFGGGWSLHANRAEGFRAPPYNDANIGFTNLQFGYTALPNPDLESESSRGLELGLRWRGDAGFVALAAYRNAYEDFIESLRSLGTDPATGLLVFQSQNIDEVTVEGLELRAAWRLGATWPALDGFELNAAASAARGTDEVSDQPLNSVDPRRLIAGLRYDAGDGRWNAELVATAVARQDRVDDTGGVQFRPPGYAVFDLFGQYRISEALRLDLGVYNLGDRRYWEWADVRGRLAGDIALDRFTRPGRSVQATLVLEL